jgi:hypothetical protein
MMLLSLEALSTIYLSFGSSVAGLGEFLVGAGLLD